MIAISSKRNPFLVAEGSQKRQEGLLEEGWLLLLVVTECGTSHGGLPSAATASHGGTLRGKLHLTQGAGHAEIVRTYLFQLVQH